MIVKVGRVGGKVLEVALPEHATVARALSAAGITKTARDTIYLNNIKRNEGISTYPAANGDLIIVEEKRMLFTPALRKFCVTLIDETEIDTDEYFDEHTESLDIEEFFNDNKSMIISLITAAKEVA